MPFPVWPRDHERFPQGGAEALVVAGGEVHQPLVLRNQLGNPSLVVAADGGWRHVQQMRLPCHHLVGDFDTLLPSEVQSAESLGAAIHSHPSDKCQSDLELALELAIEKGAQQITIVGALGGAWDHSIANLLAPLSFCFDRSVWARLVSQDSQIYYSEAALALKCEGQRVSLAAVSRRVEGLELTGFRYTLTQQTLRRDQTLCLANQTVSSEATVDFRSGELLVTVIA